MTLINFAPGVDIPLEWIIPLGVFILVLLAEVIRLHSKKSIIKTYVGIFQPSGHTKVAKLDPAKGQVTPTHLKFTVDKTEYFVEHRKPFFLPNLRTRQFENMYLLAEGSMACVDPEDVHRTNLQTKSPGRMYQVHAGLLGHIKDMLGVGAFSLSKHGYILLMAAVMGLVIGIVIVVISPHTFGLRPLPG